MISHSFSKLFSTITDSSLWCEDSDTRIVFITMLSMADAQGYVAAAIPGLSKRAGVSLEKTIESLKKFESPDPYSRNSREEGRRIQTVEGGWQLINYEFYRNLRNKEDRKEQNKEAKRRQRSKMSSNVIKSHQCQPQSSQAEAEAEAEAEADKKEERLFFEEALILWNQSSLFDRCIAFSEKRKIQGRARLKDKFFKENWKQAIERIKSSPFCKGQNDRGWKGDIDWFLKADTVQKIMEGKYDERKAPNPFQKKNPSFEEIEAFKAREASNGQ